MYKKNEKTWLKHLDFTLIDLIIMQVSFVIAYMMRHGLVNPYKIPVYARLAAILVLLDLCVVFISECYSGVLKRNRYQELRATLLHVTVIFFGILAYMFVTKQSEIYSRQVLYSFWIVDIILEYFGRISLKRIVRKQVINNTGKNDLMVVVNKANAKECLEELTHTIYADYKVSGVCITDENLIGQTIEGAEVVASADTFMEYIRTHVVDEVFLFGSSPQSSEYLAEQLVEYGLTVHINLLHESKVMSNHIIEKCGKYMVMTTSMLIATPRQAFLKRVVDIIGSVVGLIITGIAFLIFAPIIKKQSPGPIFYVQTRMGRNGRPFKFYKFRSMHVGADKLQKELEEKNRMDGHMFKLDDDPRVFPIGKFIRKYSIDELPQFWNVLRGDMSLVGTRPPTQAEYKDYEIHHKARLAIKPGLTGMWQVSGRSEITNFEEVVELDTEYIANWSFGLDFKILAQTIGVVLKAKGSK